MIVSLEECVDQEQELADLLTAHEDLKDDKTALENTNYNLQDDLDKKTTDYIKLTGEHAELRHHNTKLEDDNDRLEEEVSALEDAWQFSYWERLELEITKEAETTRTEDAAKIQYAAEVVAAEQAAKDQRATQRTRNPGEDKTERDRVEVTLSPNCHSCDASDKKNSDHLPSNILSDNEGGNKVLWRGDKGDTDHWAELKYPQKYRFTGFSA